MKNKSYFGSKIRTISAACLLLGFVPTAFAQITIFPSETLPAGTLFPIAIAKDFADQHENYNNTSNTIRLFESSSSVEPNAYFTSFLPGPGSASIVEVIALMSTGNLYPVSIGDSIGIVNGLSNAAVDNTPLNQDVVLPVVLTDSSPNGPFAVYSFIGFHIIGPNRQNTFVEGYFLDDVFIENGIGSDTAPDYGVRSPSVTSAPEPSTIALFGIGIAGIGVLGRKKLAA